MLNGYVTLIAAAIWFVYQVLAVVIPGFEIPDRSAIEALSQTVGALAGPLIVAALRLRTTGPVGPVVQNLPILGAIAKKPGQ